MPLQHMYLPYGLTGKVEVLADMPYINENDTMCRFDIAPFHTIRDGCPDENNGSLCNEALPENCMCYLVFFLLIKRA